MTRRSTEDTGVKESKCLLRIAVSSSFRLTCTHGLPQTVTPSAYKLDNDHSHVVTAYALGLTRVRS